MTRHLNAFTASFSAHLFLLAALIWLSAQAVRHEPTARADGPVKLAPTLELPKPVKPIPTSATTEHLAIPTETKTTTLEMPNFTFDFGKIAARAASLFPFLTDDLAINPIREMAARQSRGGLPNPYAAEPDKSERPPLTMTDSAMQTLVDKTFSRRERWTPFQQIARLTEKYSAVDGRLPALLRKYAENNLLQPYVDIHIKDPRLWAMLRISSDHADFVDFIMKYVAAHPSTKATTELLFMLDDMVQGSRDTLLALLEIDPDKDLYWTGRTNRDAHDLIAIIQPHYRAKLEQRGIATSEGVTLWYDNVRLEILAAIVSTTPGRYRADDARYLIGSILWKNERRDEALTWWNELRVDPANRYAEASAATLAAIANRPAETVSAAAIKQIAAKERRRWVDFWWNRLHQFGQSFSSF